MLGYGAGMSEMAEIPAISDNVESVVSAELAHGDGVLGTVAPILRHLIASDDRALFGEEPIARVRGMLGDLARQLLEAPLTEPLDEAQDPARVAVLLTGFFEIPGMLGHVHALALEGQLAERLHSRLALDPVLPPLLQVLIASPDAPTAASVMNLLAAQARFIQTQRRMQLPLTELPGDLLHGALLVMRTHAAADDRASAAEAEIRARYDESRSRLGLIARLVTGMGAGAVAALSVTHAGVAIFATALALASGQDRDLAVLSTNETQLARLALALRAAGVKVPGIEEQFLALHPEVALPEGFDRLGPDRAAAMLARSAVRAGG